MSGSTARIPHVSVVVSNPRWRTSRPASVTTPTPAHRVNIRAAARAESVPVSSASAASGASSKVIPGGCTNE